nr:MAG TPA: hypothetical protein [Caudoviricetes sp.]
MILSSKIYLCKTKRGVCPSYLFRYLLFNFLNKPP